MKRQIRVGFRDDGRPFMEWSVASNSSPHWVIVWDYLLVNDKSCRGAVTWHAPTPIYEWDAVPAVDFCLLVDGRCYVDVGYLMADEMWDRLQLEGDEAVWLFLEDCLRDRMLGALSLGSPR